LQPSCSGLVGEGAVEDDWVDTPENGAGTYDGLVRPGDLKILAASAQGSFNLLHVCGKALGFGRIAANPVHAINWADCYAGPAIADIVGWIRPALCAGLDNLGTMVSGSPEDCAQQVADALQQSGGRPLLLAPGCTFDPDAVPRANLHAIRQAVAAQSALGKQRTAGDPAAARRPSSAG